MNPAGGWIPAELVHAAGWTLVHFLWQGALIAAVLSVALRTTRSARARHDLALAALLAMAAAPVATFAVVRANAPILVLMPPGVGAEADWQAPVVAAWALGVLIFAIRTAGGLWLVERLRREAFALPAA